MSKAEHASAPAAAGLLPPLLPPRQTAAGTSPRTHSENGKTAGERGGSGRQGKAVKGGRGFFDQSRLVPVPVAPQPLSARLAHPSSAAAVTAGPSQSRMQHSWRGTGDRLTPRPVAAGGGGAYHSFAWTARATPSTTPLLLCPHPSSSSTAVAHARHLARGGGGEEEEEEELSPLLSSLPVKQWALSAQLERDGGRRNLDLAKALFKQVVLPNTQNALAVTAVGESTPVEQLTMLATRVAVSALLVQETVLALPRHQRVLVPYVHMLLSAVFVPENAGSEPTALSLPDRTLALPAILDGLRGRGGGKRRDPHHPPHPREGQGSQLGASGSAWGASSTGATVGAAVATVGDSSSSDSTCGKPALRDSLLEDDYLAALLASGGGGGSGGEEEGDGATTAAALARLLSPFARKPFFIALIELAQNVTLMAHAARSHQLHGQKLPAIFAMTHVSWTRTLLRTVMRAWWKLCAERRVRLQKHRARWAQRWSTERVRVGLRRWRGLAAYTLQVAETDSAAKAAIEEKKESIRRCRVEVEGMLKTSGVLDESLKANEEERTAMEKALAQSEHSYKEMLSKVQEADRVGTVMLDYLLLPLDERCDGVLGSRSRPAPHLTEMEKRGASLPFGASPEQQHYIGSLRVLVEWANRKLMTDGRDTEEMCALSPTSAETRQRQRRMRPTPERKNTAEEVERTGQEDEEAEEEEMGGAAGESASPASGDAGAAVVEHVFTQLLLPHDPTYSSIELGGGISDNGSGASGDPGAFVPIPVYKYLVLMRCFRQAEVNGGYGTHPNAPAMETVRMVKTADAAVLDCLRSLRHLAERRALGDGRDGSHGRRLQTNSGGVSEEGEEELDADRVVELLPDDLRTTAEDVAKILVDSYERLTGTACVVTSQQLLHRGRGVQLVFLAALFRHYTNWSVRRARVEEALLAQRNSASSSSNAPPLDSVGDMTPAALRSLAIRSSTAPPGRRHVKYGEWYYPSTAHLQWLARVRNQQAWIAQSFSALHRAQYECTRSRPSLSLEEQDVAVSLVRSLSLSRLADVLPASPNQTAQFYVSLVKTMQQYFSRLRSVFLLYALPLDEITGRRKAAIAATHGTPSHVGKTHNDDTNSSNSSQTSDGDSGSDKEDGGGSGSGAAERHLRREQRKKRKKRAGAEGRRWYMTANGFWHLLCDAGVAGGGGGGGSTASAGSATLHRLAVLSIVEHVVFRSLDTEAAASGRGGRPTGNGASPRDNRKGGASQGVKARDVKRHQQVGTSKLVPCFARAMMDEDRHVDLRHDRATVCLDMYQFAEALVRCAHYWQAIRSDAPKYSAYEESRGRQQQQQRWSGKPSLNKTRSSVGSSIAFLSGSPLAGTALSRRASFVSGAAGSPLAITLSRQPSARVGNSVRGRQQQQQHQHQQGPVSNGAAATTTTTTAHMFVCYEGLVGDCPPLSPQLLEVFVVDWILPHCLAGAGGSTSAAQDGNTTFAGRGSAGSYGGTSVPCPLSAFRRAIRQPSVQKLLAAHQEALFKVFARFSKPREAFGARSALPPPFSYYCVLPATGQRGQQPQQQQMTPPSTNPADSQRRRRSSVVPTSKLAGVSAGHAAGGGTAEGKGKLRDVGIVAVMSLADVLTMAKDLQWNQFSHDTLSHCFTNVIADEAREGGAMFFPEFLDFLCAVATYAERSPLLPLPVKLERFLAAHVLTDDEDGA